MNGPRVGGSKTEWSGGTTEERQLVQRLNMAFVETVRATGGNNTNRVLLITSYGASSSRIAMYGVKVPNDPYVGVSIHAYTPYNFTFNTKNEYDEKLWDGSRKGDVDALFRDLNDIFLEKGIPVVLTEFGAENKTNLPGGEGNAEARCEWISYYISKAKEKGVPCVIWDNGIYNADGERFGVLDRKNLTWYEPAYVEAMVEAATK
jgi:endoglucanase